MIFIEVIDIDGNHYAIRFHEIDYFRTANENKSDFAAYDNDNEIAEEDATFIRFKDETEMTINCHFNRFKKLMEVKEENSY